MSDDRVKKLVTMANQIARFFQNQPEAKAVANVTDHIRRFWEPRMRAAIIAHLEAGGAGLSPLAAEAVHVLAGTHRTDEAADDASATG